jgi:hypothetical protein
VLFRYASTKQSTPFRQLSRALGAKMSKNISPVGWYVGSYLARFIELEDPLNNDPESRFSTWENTVIVKAVDLDEAFDKIESIGIEHAEPYKGGSEGIPVKWEYLGVTEVLPIYEELEDGAEIMFTSRHPRKLKNLMCTVMKKGELAQ